MPHLSPNADFPLRYLPSFPRPPLLWQGDVPYDRGEKTEELEGMLSKLIYPLNTRGGASNQTAISKHQLSNFCTEECTVLKVFDCPVGELPVVPDHVEEEAGRVYFCGVVGPFFCASTLYWYTRLATPCAAIRPPCYSG